MTIGLILGSSVCLLAGYAVCAQTRAETVESGQPRTVYLSVKLSGAGLKSRCPGVAADVQEMQRSAADQFKQNWRYLYFKPEDAEHYPQLEIDVDEQTDTRLLFRFRTVPKQSMTTVDQLDWIFAGPTELLPPCGDPFRAKFTERVAEFLADSNKRDALSVALFRVPLGTAVYPVHVPANQDSVRLTVIPLEWEDAKELANSGFKIDYAAPQVSGVTLFSRGVGQCYPFGIKPMGHGLLVRNERLHQWEEPQEKLHPIDDSASVSKLRVLKPIQFFLTDVVPPAGLVSCSGRSGYREAREP